jgi:hypothetical protein
MTIESIRFRVSESLVVLQVFDRQADNQYSYKRDGTWRDAKAEDLLEVARFCSTDTDRRIASLEEQIRWSITCQQNIGQTP